MTGQALLERHGGGDRTAVTGVVLIGLSAIASFVFWFVPGWSILLAVGAALVAAHLRAFGVAPRGAGELATAGAAATAVIGLVGASMDAFDGGDNLQALMWSLVAAAQITYAAGIMRLGQWLAGEVPADDPDQTLVA